MSTAPVKDILLVGFGGVGMIYSYILKKSGLACVTVVARSNYDAAQSHGIHIKSRKYGEHIGWRPDRLCKSVADAADRAYAYVILTTKAIPEVTPTPKILQPLLSTPYSEKYPQPTYVLLQNGLNVEIDLYEALKKLGKDEPSIVSSSVYIGSNLTAPHVVEHGDFDRLTLGVYRHKDCTTVQNTSQETALLEDIGGILRTGGSTITIVPEIQRSKFSKNFWNVGFSSFSTLTGYRLPSIFRPPPTESTGPYEPFVSPATANLIESYTIPTIKALLEELIVVGRAMGFPDSVDGIPSALAERIIESTKALHRVPDSAHTPSMLLDLQKNQPIEVEVIFGEVVRMARELKVDVPRLEMLYALLLVVQNQIIRKGESGDTH